MKNEIMKKKGLNKKVIIGIVIGGLMLLAIAAYFLLPSLVSILSGRAITTPEEVNTTAPSIDISLEATPEAPREVSPIYIGVTNISPLNLAKNQGVMNNIIITFSEAMNPTTIDQDSFIVKGPNNAIINGVITSDPAKKIWTFNPKDNLKFNSIYNVTVTTGAKGVSGNSLSKNFMWSFITSHGGGSSGGGSSSTSTSAVTLILTTITLLPISTSIAIGESQQLNTAGLDQSGNSIAATITYTTSNATVAIVNSTTGLVTAVAVGNATITAISGTISNTSVISVVAAPVLTTITLSPSSANLTINSTKQMIAAGLDQFLNSTSATITYNSSNATVATVNATTGLVTALAVGNTTITGANGTINGTSIIFVNTLTSINLIPTTKNLSINATQQMNATDMLGNSFAAGTITYNSSNATVATVNATTGLVTALAAGNTTINASNGEISNTSIIYVSSLTSIALLPATKNITVGSTQQMNATDQFGNIITLIITYNSSNTTVATVNATTGLVTALAVGNTTINTSSGTISNTSIIFVTAAPAGCLAATVNLGTAGDFAILSKSGISTTGTTSITGDIGVSPAAASYITGFGLVMDVSTTFSKSSLVNGNVYAASYTAPTPAKMTTAVSNMETAYTTANGLPACVTELGAGNIGGMTLTPGVYKWGTDVTIPTNVTLSGNSTDVWVFQIAGKLDISSAKGIVLNGGAQAKNIYWVVADTTTLGTTSVFNGNILDQTNIAVLTGAKLNGRALAQTAVTLDANNVTRSV